MSSRYRHSLGAAVVLGAYAAAAGCVGDDPSVGPSADAGQETATSDGHPSNEGGEADGHADSGSDPDADAGTDAACSALAPFKTLQQVTSIDTTASEEGAWFSPDEKIAYITTRRPDSGAGGNDIFSASRLQRGDPFSAFTLMANINSTANDEIATVSRDGLTIYLASDRPGLGSFDIYVATRATASADFGAPSPVANVNGTSYDYPTWISPDGNTLYLESARDNPKGALYRSARVGGTFQPAVAVSELSSVSGESAGVLSPDQLVIYFFSRRTGTGALGGGDIWMATRGSTSDPFTSLAPLTSINSDALDVPEWASPDGCRLYIRSQRSGSSSDDIWLAER